MATWSDLENELDRWRTAQLVPTLWWRDDDAHAATPELEHLLELAEGHHVPVHLAVIPDLIQADLADRLTGCRFVHLLQHGFAHINHEPIGLGASEFGNHRDIEMQLRDLRNGWQCLVKAQLPNLLPGVAPPWNRMSDATLAELPGLGYRFISAFEGPTSNLPVDGLIRVNAHVDPIRWRHERRFRGTEATLELLTNHLEHRRKGRVDLAEPTGILTHHLETGADIWEFMDRLFDRLSRQGIAKWISLAALVEPG